MRIEGNIQKVGSWWAVEIPLLLIHSQGKTKKRAFEMAKDAVEALVDDEDFYATIFSEKGDCFSVKGSNDSFLMALALKQQRHYYKLSIRDVAERMGSNSPAAYSRYEQGKTKPSIDKFTEILKAIHEDLEPILRISSF